MRTLAPRRQIINPKDYCLDGLGHCWDTTNECLNGCDDGNCCVTCSECDAVDCYCEGY